MFKNLFSLLFFCLVAVGFSEAQAQSCPFENGSEVEEYGGCHEADSLSAMPNLLSSANREKIKKQEACCNKGVYEACDSAIAVKACQMLAGGGFKGADCPPACKAWAQDCVDHFSISNAAVKKCYDKKDLGY